MILIDESGRSWTLAVLRLFRAPPNNFVATVASLAADAGRFPSR